MAEYTENQLIIVKQLPIIEQQLKGIKVQFEKEASEALALECTEENLQTVKKKRADLTKIFNALESKRKEAKKAILAPYEAFEEIYKECVSEIYLPCDRQLADKIHEVEDELKAQKRGDAEEYFNEYCQSKNIDFLEFDRLGINITLTASRKSLHEQIKEFVDKVCDELKLIETQENSAEIFVEYKESLNVAQAITLVVGRHRAIEEEKRRKEELQAVATEKAKAVSKVEEVIEESIMPPKEEAVTEEEQKYKVTFSVIGTLAEIKALKKFLVEGDYQYEQQ